VVLDRLGCGVAVLPDIDQSAGTRTTPSPTSAIRRTTTRQSASNFFGSRQSVGWCRCRSSSSCTRFGAEIRRCTHARKQRTNTSTAGAVQRCKWSFFESRLPVVVCMKSSTQKHCQINKQVIGDRVLLYSKPIYSLRLTRETRNDFNLLNKKIIRTVHSTQKKEKEGYRHLRGDLTHHSG